MYQRLFTMPTILTLYLEKHNSHNGCWCGKQKRVGNNQETNIVYVLSLQAFKDTSSMWCGGRLCEHSLQYMHVSINYDMATTITQKVNKLTFYYLKIRCSKYDTMHSHQFQCNNTKLQMLAQFNMIHGALLIIIRKLLASNNHRATHTIQFET